MNTCFSASCSLVIGVVIFIVPQTQIYSAAIMLDRRASTKISPIQGASYDNCLEG